MKVEFQRVGLAVACIAVLFVASLTGLPRAEAQANDEPFTIELTFETETGAPAGPEITVTDIASGQRYGQVSPESTIKIDAQGQTELEIGPGPGQKVSSLTCDGVARARIVISATTRMFVTAEESAVACTVVVTMSDTPSAADSSSDQLAVTGVVSDALGVLGVALLGAGALCAGTARVQPRLLRR